MVEYKIDQITEPIKDVIIESHGFKGALSRAVGNNILYKVENTKSGRIQIYEINIRSFISIGDSSKIEEWEKYEKNITKQYHPKEILEKIRKEDKREREYQEEQSRRHEEYRREMEENQKVMEEICAKEGHDLEIKKGRESWRQPGVYLHDQYVHCKRCNQIMQNPKWNKAEEEKKRKIEALLEELSRKEENVRKLGIQQKEIRKIEVLLEELRGKEVDKRKPAIQQQETQKREVLITETKRKLIGTIKRADGTIIKEVWSND